MKVLLIGFTILVFFSGQVFSQQDTTKRNNRFILKADLLLPSLFLIRKWRCVSVTVEKEMKGRYSAQLTGVVYNETYSTDWDSGPYLYHRYSGWQIIPDLKIFYSENKSHHGFYSGIYCKISQYTFFSEIYDGYHSRLEYIRTNVAEGLISGFQTNFTKKLIIDILIGFGVSENLNTKVLQEVYSKVWRGPGSFNEARIAVNIGYKF